LNVAVTRAKRHCALICDCETVSQNKFIKGLIDWFEHKGDCRSAAEMIASPSPNETNAHVHPKYESNKVKQTTKHKVKVIKEIDQLKSSTESIEPATTANEKQDALKEGAQRRALMNRIGTFSETQQKGDQLVLRDLSGFDMIIARELSSQLGLDCVSSSDNELTLTVVKEVSNLASHGAITQDASTSMFSQLDLDDDDESSKDSDVDASGSSAPNSLLKGLALERQMRQTTQLEIQSNGRCNQSSKKGKKKKKGQKLGGERKQVKESNDDDLGDLDDMAFLDAQIEKVQTSHGRKIEAKGKGYKSIMNGVLLTKYDRPDESKQRNTAASSILHTKIKAKSEDRQVKKKKGK
jgi:hypothetical protein